VDLFISSWSKKEFIAEKALIEFARNAGVKRVWQSSCSDSPG